MGRPGASSLRSTVAREGTQELRGHHLSWLPSIRAGPPPAAGAGLCLLSSTAAQTGACRVLIGVVGGSRPLGELRKPASSLGEGGQGGSADLAGLAD